MKKTAKKQASKDGLKALLKELDGQTRIKLMVMAVERGTTPEKMLAHLVAEKITPPRKWTEETVNVAEEVGEALDLMSKHFTLNGKNPQRAQMIQMILEHCLTKPEVLMNIINTHINYCKAEGMVCSYKTLLPILKDVNSRWE